MEAMRTRTVSPIRSGALSFARAIRLIGTAVAAVIVVGMLMVILDASTKNDTVQVVTDVARWLTDPFHGVFDVDSKDGRTAANWGLAAVVYFAISRVLSRVLTR